MRECKAAVLDGPGAKLRVARVEIEPPQTGEVLVRIRACGVCRSDRHAQMTGEPLSMPAVLGHEAAGVIAEVGAGVEDFSPGDHVVIAWTPSCGRCRPCRRGAPNLCAALQVSSPGRLREGERQLNRYMSVGGFAEYTVAAAGQAIKIRRDAPLDRVCLIGCGVMTGFGAAARAGGIRPGHSVAVFGCGAVGLSAIQGAAAAGAHPLIAVDISDEKLAVAQRVGATVTVNAHTGDAATRVSALTGGLGADVVIEAVGSPEVLQQAMAVTAPGGTAVTVGLTSLAEEIRFSPLWLLLDRTLRGSIYGSANPALDFPQFADWYMDGRLHLDELVTRTVPLDDVNEALDALDRGSAIRSVIVMGGAA